MAKSSKPKPAQAEEELETTVDNDTEMDESQIEEETRGGTFDLVDENASIAYDDEEDTENSPEVANVVPDKGKGTKRKPVVQEVVEGRQNRKKQKSPNKPSSLFDTDSDGSPMSASTPALPPPEKVPAKGKKGAKAAIASPPRPTEEIVKQDEEMDAIPPAPAPKAKRGAKAAIVSPTEEMDAIAVLPPAPAPKAKRGAKVASPSATKKGKPQKETPIDEQPGPSRTRAPVVRLGTAQEEPPKPVKVVKARVPMMSDRIKPIHKPIKDMLEQAMDVLNEPRRGITFNDVKRYLHVEFDYSNETAIKKAVRTRIQSGEYVKTTATHNLGISGKFKLAPKPKPEKKPKAVVKKPGKVASATKAEPKPLVKKLSGAKARKGATPVAAMAETKPDKRRKSLKLQAPKKPTAAKAKKADSKGAKATNEAAKVTKMTSAPAAKATKK